MKIKLKERRRFTIFLIIVFAILFILSLIFLMRYNQAKRALYINMPGTPAIER